MQKIGRSEERLNERYGCRRPEQMLSCELKADIVGGFYLTSNSPAATIMVDMLHHMFLYVRALKLEKLPESLTGIEPVTKQLL